MKYTSTQRCIPNYKIRFHLLARGLVTKIIETPLTRRTRCFRLVWDTCYDKMHGYHYTLDGDDDFASICWILSYTKDKNKNAPAIEFCPKQIMPV